MLHCVWLIVVFFFKQKTAYEMRISDWSSDVCSSDLRSSECGQAGGRRSGGRSRAGSTPAARKPDPEGQKPWPSRLPTSVARPPSRANGILAGGLAQPFRRSRPLENAEATADGATRCLDELPQRPLAQRGRMTA